MSAPSRLLRPGGLRELLRLTAEAAIVGTIASIVLLIAALLIAQAAHAASPAPSSGTLFLKTDVGVIPAPLVATDVQIEVSGTIARTRVTQRFVNPGEDWREGVYAFPLPESAAVDHLDMQVGTRVITGRIRERGSARREYEKAKHEGRKAALIEQERPNLFTTNVAAIGPGEEVLVSIEYQESLRFDTGSFTLRFPMAIMPRYVPGMPVEAPSAGMGVAADTSEVPDASRISPPVIDPREGKGLPVTLSIAIDAGFPLARIDSPHHAIDIVEYPGSRYGIALADGPVPADRDFELVYTPDVGRAPAAAVFGEAVDGEAYVQVMLVPSLPEVSSPRTARELTFVVDTSGSMAGASLVQAKAALGFALDRLTSGDRFNVIEFNTRARALFAAPMPADPATLGRARSFVSGLRADGGTEMREALELALAPDPAPGLVRQVVFLTDGAVANETALFALIRERLGDRRLFTIGIGSAPNSHFMTTAARFGRGTFTYIGDTREVQEKMAVLLTKLESPVLTDVALDWPAGADAWPARVPDLYAGEPIVVTARLARLAGEVNVTGMHDGKPWRASLPLGLAGDAAGVGVLWARARIQALDDALVAGGDAEDIRAEIVRIALAHHLVTKHTSLVAVDVTPSAPPGTIVRPAAVPGNLPAGHEFEAVVEGLPQTATTSRRDIVFAMIAFFIGLLLFMRARRAPSPLGKGLPAA